jgi:hypothetical protein
MTVTPNSFISPQTPNSGGLVVSAANTAYDGTGTTVLLFTAGANGAKVDRVSLVAMGTNVASVFRLFHNNASDPATAANNRLIWECTLPATTASQIAALAALPEYIPSTPLMLKAGERLYGSVGTVIAAGVMRSVWGGDL